MNLTEEPCRTENMRISLIYGEAVACIQAFYQRKGMGRWQALAKAKEMFERARLHHLEKGNARTLQDDLTKYFEVPDLLTGKLEKWEKRPKK